MFRVMELAAGRVDLYEGIERVAPPPSGVVRWIDLCSQDVPQLERLREQFGFHPLAIEDCANFDQRPKLEEYEDHLFLVTQGFACVGATIGELKLHELHTFLGERYLIADGIVDDNFPILDTVADELETLEDSVLDHPQRKDLQRIFELKHHLVVMRRVLSPQRDVLGFLAKRGDPRISDRTALYLRDVYDHLVRINESIESNRDLLSNALEAYLSAVGQRTNEIMKALTIMSAVFLPLAFVVGFFGQNFRDLPFLDDWTKSDGLMYVMIAICVGTPTGMVLWFRRKGWL